MKTKRKEWPSLEAATRYFKAEGFIVGKCVCRQCGNEDDGAVEPGADLSKLECTKCGEFDSLFTQR